jgi:hypothetical protein
VRYTNTNGGLTGFAVQNLGNSTLSYSGMLFYDHNGVLGQFQGFNNVTHEYRINNIAKNGASQLDGSINFMLGGTSRFQVASTGQIGMGTTTPVSALEVSNALSFTGSPDVTATAFSLTGSGPSFLGRKARGSGAAPSAVQSGDTLAVFAGKGYGTTAFNPSLTGTGGMSVQATQTWTDTSQPTSVSFYTTPSGSTLPASRMTIGPGGNVGIGTTAPTSNLEVASLANNVAAMVATSYSSSQSGSIIQGRKARGTPAAPTAVQANDILASFSAEGYGSTGFGLGPRAAMIATAGENWTDAAQATQLSFLTTPPGSNAAQNRLQITADGYVGMGTTAPTAPLEVVRTGIDTGIVSTLYANGADAGSFLVAQSARGTAAAPTAIQAGDFLGAVLFNGYGATNFSEGAAVGAFAAETFTGTASGSVLVFATTPIGANDGALAMALLPSGNLGIGTPLDGSGLPTATDKLQVFGDIRVGTTGTNGCVKNFAGTQLTGTRVSDRRYKKGITPFGSTLDRLAALQPVHFYWRSDEFPDQHFGDSQAYGLIAQDVAKVMPELVVTDKDGYMAVDYSKLPLLTIQAVKELKAENEVLRQQLGAVDELKQRVADLERLLKQLQQPPANQR